MGKQDRKENRDNGMRGKMQDQKFTSYRSLLTTFMNEVKAIRGSKTHSGRPSINLLDIDIPTMNLAVNIPDYQAYVERMIQSYDKYLGYASGISFGSVRDVFKYGLDLYCYMWMIFRYYQSNEVKLPTGEEVNGIYEYCTTPIWQDNDTQVVVSSRVDSSLKGISNKVWESDYISRVEQVLLPPQVLEFYNYYLSQLFNVSDNDSKENLTLTRVWVAIEDYSFITIPNSDGTFPKLKASTFKSIFTNLSTVLTPKVRDFLCAFLGWAKPNQDWTRPITSDIVYVNDDAKFKSTFNMLFPEKVACNIAIGDNVEQTLFEDFEAVWTRYYYDLEILMNCNTADEFVATKYFFGIDNVNLEQYVMMQNEEMNDIKIDFYNYLLLTVLASEEISGSKDKYVGGIYSAMTKINCITGEYNEDRSEMDQIYMGNDLKLQLYDFAYDTDSEDALQVLSTHYAGLVGDALEVCEYSENLAIFNYPIKVPEVWDVLWKYNTLDYPAQLIANVIVNGYLSVPYDPATNNYTDNLSCKINHDFDFVSFDTYTMDPNEVHLALQTTIFSFLTGFNSYNESIQFIDNLFRNKQQETN